MCWCNVEDFGKYCRSAACVNINNTLCVDIVERFGKCMHVDDLLVC